MNYTYAIERSAAEAVFQFSARERRLLQVAFVHSHCPLPQTALPPDVQS